VHVQAVNRYLAIAAGKMQDPSAEGHWAKPEQAFSQDNYPLLPAMGVMWEEFAAGLYTEQELWWQPGEYERDGIYGTPDGLLIGAEPVAIWEAKLTFRKLQPVGEVWMYLKQGLAYCALTGFDRVQYEVCWALGDYSRPYTPVATRTVVQFESREVEAWWSAMFAVKGAVKAEAGTIADE
jgi:hypothetical protein